MEQGARQGERMRLSVTDFGPIAAAEIDLRPLTIFVGPSNTGKSYLATLVYALSRHLSERLAGQQGGEGGLGWPEAWTGLSQDEETAFGEWVLECMNRLAAHRDDAVPLPSALQDSVRRAICARGSDGRAFDPLLVDCFGIRDTRLLRRNGSRRHAHVRVAQLGGTGKPEAVLDARVGRDGTSVDLNASPDVEVTLPPLWGFKRLYESISDLGVGNGTTVRELSNRITHGLFAEMCGRVRPPLAQLVCPPHYLPADRTGVVHSHSLVVSSLIRRTTPSENRPGMPKPTMSGVLGDFYYRMSTMNGSDGDFGELGGQIERNILDGTIITKRDAGTSQPAFFYLPTRWDAKRQLPLMSTSSMISELAPVVLYLRNLVRKGDLLIIEEPESHLHPAVQAELAVYIAKLVRSGVKVIVTTHSEWLLEQFGNLARLSGLAPDQRRGIERAHPSVEGAALEDGQVGAWLFETKSRPRGSVVREFRLDEESRVLPDQFTDVTVQLYEEWRKISSRMRPKQP